MIRFLLALFCFIAQSTFIFGQCTTTNATSCVCQNGGTLCDLLPDIKVARPPLLVNGSSGYIEYPQVCNPSCNGNDGRLRISVSTPNIGLGPLEVRSTNIAICGTDTFYNVSTSFTCPNGQPLMTPLKQRIYRKNGNTMTFTDRNAGTMTYHPSHGHMHVNDWGVYSLRTSTPDPNPLNWPVIGTGSKLAFCLMDYGSCSTYNGHCTDSANNVLINSSFPNFGLGGGNYGCSASVQGISSGYTDIYYQSLDGMYINLPAGLCNGNYWIVVHLDPYNYFLESNENNNVLAVPVTLTQQGGTLPVITASGATTFCQGGSVSLSATPAQNYLWSTGATTQSITVNQAGSYSVTVNSGTACVSTSSPTTVTVTQLPITASATPSTICPGENVTLQASSSSSGTTNQNVTFSNTNSYAIPDNNTSGVSSPISVSGVNPSTINSSSIVSVTVNITHTYDGDLQLLLVSPSQNSIILSNRRGGSGDNYTNTVFTASAATAITSGSAPFIGSYRPEGLFSNLTGNVNGTWVLKAIDLAGNDIGTINNWTLSLTTVVPTTLSYTWTSTPPGFSASGSTATVTPSASTAYTVTVTESGTGCQNSQAVQVNVNSTMQLAVNNPSPICSGTSTTLNASGASTYVWSPATGLSSTTGSSVTANPGQTTTYTVQGTSGSCTDSRTVTVVVEEQASTPAGINGPSSGCSPFSAGYTVNGPVSGMTYSWTAPAGMNLSQPTGTNVNLTASGAAAGNLCVAAGNSCGSSAARCMSVSVIGGAPTTPASIFGTSAVCPGDVVSYLAAVSTGASSYNWTIPSGTTIVSGQGTRTLNLQFNSSFTGGIISVVAVNSCGSSATTTRSLTLNPPSTPSVITGNGTGLCNLLEAFSVTATSGMSYVWTVPSGASIVSGQGTSAISVQFSSTFGKGSISVVAQNTCGTSTSRTKSVNGAPALPGAISGATVVCKGQNGVAYSIAPVYGANSYLWTMPRNTVIVSGQGSTSILANYKTTASSGDVRVKASNSCSTTLNQKLAVTVNTCPRSSDEASSFTGEWSIVPNPASEQTKIVFGVKEDAIAEVNLTNVIGQSVYRQQIRTHAGNNSFSIDLRKLPRGVYFVTLTQNGESNSKRLIIE
ncbi:MAG: hypothetical protein RLZZ630_1296 [Bacteroidota bacterium]